MLRDMTDASLIRLHIQADGWEDAIRKAAQPLVDTHRILNSYVDDIIEGVHQYGPYIVLAKNVALPHARPQAGALENAIGIATLDPPVDFGSEANDPVKYMFCLSATDDMKHLSGLAQLAELLEDSSFLTMLDQAAGAEEILAWLEKH